jgi:UDP-glucose:(heptosyl)LPS alpha-1,3-glucosyltransferase
VKVALIMERIEPWRGGAETSAQQFIQHLARKGIHLEIVTRSRLPAAPRMNVHTIKPGGTTRALRTAGFVREADRMASRLEVDLIHAITPCMSAHIYEPRGGTTPETIERNLALRPVGPRRSLKRMANWFNRRQRWMLRLESALLRRNPPPLVIALSDYVIRQLQRHYQFPVERIRKVFNGVDPDPANAEARSHHRTIIRQMYGIGEDEPLALAVAHNFRLKGIGRWIEATALLKRQHGLRVRSLVVGKENPIRWQRVAASQGVGDCLQFVGPTKRISAFYHAADLLVHPTYYDPCSRVVLEALAHGLPCITTRFDGSSEVVQPGLNGYVLDDPEDVASLVGFVLRLADPAVRSGMVQCAVASGRTANMQRHAEKLIEVYNELVPAKAPA